MSYPSTLLSSLFAQPVRRRCFVSYHHADEDEVRNFVYTFSDVGQVFTHSALGLELEPELINSSNTDYVMQRIRQLYMQNTSVTLVMIGRETWARRYVDWEIAASLRNAQGAPANGLLGIKLPSYVEGDNFPPRLNDNLNTPPVPADNPCYARWMAYPTTNQFLADQIELAIQRRDTRSHLINNRRERFGYNRS